MSVDTTNQAAIFASEYAKDAGREMLTTIRRITNRSGRITKIALGVSMPHQIGYILALAVPHMHFTNPSAVLESITMILLAFGAPIATDLLILNCIETIGAAAAARASKRRAFRLMFIPVLASGTVNFLAPAPWLIKCLAAFIVTMVPMGESLRFIRPDFAKIEQMQNEVASEVTQPSTAGRKLTEEQLAQRAVAREWNRYQKMSAYQRKRYRDEHGGPPPQPARMVRGVSPVSPGAVSFEELDADRAVVGS